MDENFSNSAKNTGFRNFREIAKTDMPSYSLYPVSFHAKLLPSHQWLKWLCEAGGGGSPDEARLEQTPYPFQPH